MITWVLRESWSVDVSDGALVVERSGNASHIALGAMSALNIRDVVTGQIPASGLSEHDRLVLDRLEAAGVIARRVIQDGAPYATHLRTQSLARASSTHPRDGTSMRLHSSVHLRQSTEGVELAGGSWGDAIQLHSNHAVCAAAHLLQSSRREPADHGERVLAELMEAAGMYADEDRKDGLAGWDPHDVIFHLATRADTTLSPYGARSRDDRRDPAAAVRRPSGSVALESFDWDDSNLVGLARLLQVRQTVREHGEKAVNLSDLAFVLQASLGVRLLIEDDRGERAFRAIPTGGGKSGLNAVILAQHIEGLHPGIYEYNAVEHSLALLKDFDGNDMRWFGLASRLTATRPETIQSLILFTLSYGRPRQAYDSIIYSSALKETGAALQSMALASAERGLAFSPLGGGFSFVAGSALAGLPVVGEAMIGSQPLVLPRRR